jgi:HAD superfamily hydrolase (TIGR01509 family)
MAESPHGPARRAVIAATESVVFDLDGVLTDTAELHFLAWRELLERVRGPGEPPLSREEYREVLDGRERLTGLDALLAVRRHPVPVGAPTDPPTQLTLHGLAALKQGLFRDLLETRGVTVFPDARRLLDRLVDSRPLAVVSASRNLPSVLRASALGPYFTTVIDGNLSAELGLAAKPAPDSYLEAARRLGRPPDRLMLIEDAEAGVAAGRAAGYAVVVGVDRDGHRSERLRDAGADLVVTDLDSLV